MIYILETEVVASDAQMVTVLGVEVLDSSASDTVPKGIYLCYSYCILLFYVATGLPRTDVSNLKRGGISKTRTSLQATSNSSNSKSNDPTGVSTAQSSVAVVAPSGHVENVSSSIDSDSDDLICLGETTPRTPKSASDVPIKSEPDSPVAKNIPLKSSSGKILMSAWMKNLYIRNNVPFPNFVSDALVTTMPSTTAVLVSTPSTSVQDAAIPVTSLPTAVVKPTDPRPVAQSTPVGRQTRSQKRLLPEPSPPCVVDSQQPDKKKRKPQKPRTSKSGSKTSKKPSSSGSSASDTKVTSVKAVVLPTTVINTTVALATTTVTTTTTNTAPSTIAGDVNKTVISDQDVDVKRASNTDGSTSGDDTDAYDDTVTKQYINLRQRYSAEYADKGIKIKISSKDVTGGTAKTGTKSSKSSPSSQLPSKSSTSVPCTSKPTTSNTPPKNLHQVIKDNKKDTKKRRRSSPPSDSQSYFPFSEPSSSGSKGVNPSIGKVATEPIVQSKKKVASKVVIPSTTASSSSTMPHRSADQPVQKKSKLEKKASSSSDPGPLIPVLPSTSNVPPPVVSAPQGSSGRSDPSGSGSSRSNQSVPSGSGSGSSRSIPTAPSGSGSGSGSSRSGDGSNRPVVRFSQRDGTVKLNSDGYQRLEIREDPLPLECPTANQSQITNHQK